MAVIHINKLLNLCRSNGNWYRRPHYLGGYISRRHVQEFPDLKMNNELQRDHLIVLPEPINETPETCELLRLPKLGDSEVDFTKISAESLFKGFSQALCSFDDFITDFTNLEPQSGKLLHEFFKDIDKQLYPMDTAYNILMCLLVLNGPKFDFSPIHGLVNRYKSSRVKRLEGSFNQSIKDYVLRDYPSLTDLEKKMLKIYHPAKHSTVSNNLNESQIVYFNQNLERNVLSYRDNSLQTNQLFSHTVDDPDILAAISSEFELCKELHHKERTPLKITDSTYDKFMQVCPDRFVRQMLWQTRNKRCSPKGPPRYNNLGLLDDIRVIRRKLSNLLGFRTHVDYRMDDSMAQSKQQVVEVLNSLQQENIPILKDRLRELNDFADDYESNSNEGHGIQGIQPYDIDYWSHKFKYDVLIGKKDSDLREYFPLRVVMNGLMRYFGDYFGIEMKIKSGPNKFWNEDVQLIEVKRNNKALGSILFDPYYRSEKRVAYPIYGRLRSRNTDFGCLPLRFISTSYNREEKSNQAYLSVTEIIELFKYYSTVLQRLLYNYGYHELNTYGALELDAKNLLPSLCMAHLSTDYRILQSCSDRGGSKPIDAELASRLLNSVTYFKSLTTWFELYRAHLDIEAHSSLASIKSVVEEVYPIYSPFRRDPENYDYCAMPDIFVGPSDGIQYANLWSKQLANFCLQHSLGGGGNIAASDVTKLRGFNERLLDSLFNSDNLNTSKKLSSLTGQEFNPLKIGLGVL